MSDYFGKVYFFLINSVISAADTFVAETKNTIII